jgi:hypothetical protein
MSSTPNNQVALARELCRPNIVKHLMLENKLAYSFGIRVAFSIEMSLL